LLLTRAELWTRYSPTRVLKPAWLRPPATSISTALVASSAVRLTALSARAGMMSPLSSSAANEPLRTARASRCPSVAIRANWSLRLSISTPLSCGRASSVEAA